MQTNHANAIKGLSIAVIVIAALGVIGNLIGAITMMAMGPALEYASTTLEYENGYYTYSDDALAAQILMAIGSGMFVWALICCIVTLIAGIIGLRFHKNQQKLGMVFGWSIVGAILSFLCGGIVTCILLIVVAVFTSKDRQLVKAGIYDQGVIPTTIPAQAVATPAQPAQPTAGAPVQPVAATPAQPVATPEQPAAQPAAAQPAQPTATTQATDATTPNNQ